MHFQAVHEYYCVIKQNDILFVVRPIISARRTTETARCISRKPGASGRTFDRIVPFKAYCTGLLLPGSERASSRWRRAWLRIMFGGCISRCTIWWRTRHGATKLCWNALGKGAGGDERTGMGPGSWTIRVSPRKEAFGRGGAAVLRPGGKAG